MVAHGRYIEEEEAGIVKDIDHNWKARMPISLPLTEPFTEDMLEGWINNCVHLYPEFPQTIKECDKKDVLNNTRNGIPEMVIEALCKLCGIDLVERSSRWMKRGNNNTDKTLE